MTEKTQEQLDRESRLADITRMGGNAYPADVERTHTTADVLRDFDDISAREERVSIVGRVKTFRVHGGSSFLTCEDGYGAIQVFLARDVVGQEHYQFLKSHLDSGDFISVSGTLFVTKVGEKTLKAETLAIITKTLLPLPEKWHGLTDTETRYRKRYLDLIANESVREIFRTRARLITALRAFFDARDYIEVETPVLQSMAGGTMAKPFRTHHNALDIDLYLRIAPELYLKKLIIGGYERVYEIARCFRNEGIDPQHNPEFTQIEFYQAYASYRDLMKLTEDLLPYLAQAAIGSIDFPFRDGRISLLGPFPVLKFREAIIDRGGPDIETLTTLQQALAAARSYGIDIESGASLGKIYDELYKHFVRKHIVSPTFIIDHPVELSPLAKLTTYSPKYVERFQLVLAGGIELTNAFSELNDPYDQLARFTYQQQAKEEGDDEAHPKDMEFVEALMHGLPPTAGMGMGIDRLVSMLTNTHNLKEVILFPTMRPVSGDNP